MLLAPITLVRLCCSHESDCKSTKRIQLNQDAAMTACLSCTANDLFYIVVSNSTKVEKILKINLISGSTATIKIRFVALKSFPLFTHLLVTID